MPSKIYHVNYMYFPVGFPAGWDLSRACKNVLLSLRFPGTSLPSRFCLLVVSGYTVDLLLMNNWHLICNVGALGLQADMLVSVVD